MLPTTPFSVRAQTPMPPLYVVAVVFNPARYRTRYRMFKEFEAYVEQSGAILYTVEIAFGERGFVCTQKDNPRHLQLRTHCEIWLKENALNLGVARLPEDWKYVAFVDADVSFARPDWVRETVEQLQHNKVVQMFSKSLDLGPDHVPFNGTGSYGFAYCYRNNVPRAHPGKLPAGYGHPDGQYWHPGYAWAYTRKAYEDLGGLIDWAIIGAADYHMAQALLGDVESSIPKPKGGKSIDSLYVEQCLDWQTLADRHIQGHLGYVEGSLIHHFHGAKVNRRYRERWDVLFSTDYKQRRDLRRDRQGLWSLTKENPALKRALQDYFNQRNEDDISVPA
jgi:hypothetical protein